MSSDKKNRIMSFIETFRGNRKLTYDLLEMLDENSMHQIWPRPGLDTFSKHFAEMASVQKAFVEALSSGIMDFSTVPGVFDFPKDLKKKEIINMLESSDSFLENQLKKAPQDLLIDWGGDCKLSIDQHLINLISHEVFHQGMMVMAMYIFKIKLPDSWIESWALPEVA